MKRQILASGLALSLGCCLVAWSAAPVEGNRIDELIALLGSPSFVERDRAKKELEAIGQSAVEALRKAAQSDNLEVRSRASELVRKLDDRQLAANLLSPKKVNLQLKDVPVLDAIKELSKQSGYEINVLGNQNQLAELKVTLATGEVSFWEAFNKLRQAGGLAEQIQVVRGSAPRVNLPVQVQPLPAPIRPVPLPNKQKNPPGGALPVVPPAKKALPPQGNLQVQPAPAIAQVDQVQPAPVPVDPKVQLQGQNIQIQIQGVPGQPVQVIQINGQAIQIQPGGGIIAGGGLQAPPAQVRIGVLPGKFTEVPTIYAGSVRVRALPAYTTIKAKKTGEFSLALEATPEPRLEQFTLIGTPRIEKAIDDQGQEVKLATNEQPKVGVAKAPIGNVAVANLIAAGSTLRQQTVRFQHGARKATKFNELTGTLTAQVQGGHEPVVTVDNVLQAQGKVAKGKDAGSIEVQKVEKLDNGDYRLELRVQATGNQPGVRVIGNLQIQPAIAPAPAIAPVSSSDDLPELLDKNGSKYQGRIDGNRRTEVNNGTVYHVFAMVFSRPPQSGEPDRLVLSARRTTTIEVPFAFKNVPIP